MLFLLPKDWFGCRVGNESDRNKNKGLENRNVGKEPWGQSSDGTRTMGWKGVNSKNGKEVECLPLGKFGD